MSKIKDSLEANKAEILKSLPQEFHADFDSQLAAVPAVDPAPLEGAALIKAINTELADNPKVDEKAAAPELTNIDAPTVSTPATAAEIKAEEAAAFDAMTKLAAEQEGAEEREATRITNEAKAAAANTGHSADVGG